MSSSSSAAAQASASNATAHAPPHLPPPSSLVTTITPAALSSLAIYNPSLGPTEKSVHDQIVFYTSRKGPVSSDTKLREIGLAQGIVEFARGFSKTENLSSIETQKSRIVTLEIEEPGWWVLAQIDLTYIHNPSTYPPTIEYSSREVAPPLVLLAQIRQAYNQFRFHYGSFAQNHAKLGRTAFCRRLEKYWLRWAWGRWEVMLHGSPGTVAFGDGGIKMVGGRPGKEIAEEERKFLKTWAEKEKTKGMVDMVVFRFGDFIEEEEDKDKDKSAQSGYWFWGNTTKAVAAAMSTTSTLPKGKSSKGPGIIMPQDGCVFPGTGSLEARSVRDIATYISELYQFGDDISRRSASSKQKKNRKRPKGLFNKAPSSGYSADNSSVESSPRRSLSAVRDEARSTPPPPAAGSNLKPSADEASDGSRGRVGQATAEESSKSKITINANAKIFNLLTFGWSGGSTKSAANDSNTGTNVPTVASSATPTSTTTADATITSSSEPEPTPPPMTNVDPMEHVERAPPRALGGNDGNSSKSKRARFMIGFLGDVYAEDLDDDLQDAQSTGRITSRTVWAERKKPSPSPPSPEQDNASRSTEVAVADASGKGKRKDSTSQGQTTQQASINLEEFRIVVYTNHPFIFAFIFESTSAQLTSPAFYRTLHHQLAPLHGPLLKSSNLPPTAEPAKNTSSSKLLLQHPAPPKPPYDLLYNPTTLMIHSTVPPIPEPGPESSQQQHSGWTRAEAFHVHTLILGILGETMRDRAEQERSARSTRGWWINWMRLEGGEEGIVVRRAGEKKSDLAAGLGGGGAGGGDIRRYFEGLVRGVR
ncbi:uncharacterized protein H6S33_009646 [Morchella sextelata]|uniref:uncharacterized protein n=1 Tax=Morchella sextelata TaxID=1174677 RepID=UPI001D049CCD|nr:uncharacterized protein H6S33_009646 [Morchella sextelata]KAH0613266.1 hypothetical protein H6S33_009646 [Morchella sextelata]